ncbi:MAG: SAM-dependent methyltransferase [Frankiales bacterium]|nr:SAM-dependent methyltransferase [Frankiales bacterium]
MSGDGTMAGDTIYVSEHLNDLYGASEDPWHMRSGWYAERMRDLILAALPNARYGQAFHPGCGIGNVTAELARRSDHVLAADFSRDAVTATRERVGHLSNVEVQRLELPREWPLDQQFDLILLHEIGALFDPSSWADLATDVRSSLSDDATVIASHWRHPFLERKLESETLHGLLDSILGLPRQTQLTDTDFSLTVWTTRSRASTYFDSTG